jgi:hypothetical protein
VRSLVEVDNINATTQRVSAHEANLLRQDDTRLSMGCTDIHSLHVRKNHGQDERGRQSDASRPSQRARAMDQCLIAGAPSLTHAFSCIVNHSADVPLHTTNSHTVKLHETHSPDTMSDVSNHALFILMIVRTTIMQIDQCACWVVVVVSGR